jgi:hypothetical protein
MFTQLALKINATWFLEDSNFELVILIYHM